MIIEYYFVLNMTEENIWFSCYDIFLLYTRKFSKLCRETKWMLFCKGVEFYSRPWTNRILYVFSKFEPALDKTNFSSQQEGVQYGAGVIHIIRVTACIFVRVQIFNKLYWYTVLQLSLDGKALNYELLARHEQIFKFHS